MSAKARLLITEFLRLLGSTGLDSGDGVVEAVWWVWAFSRLESEKLGGMSAEEATGLWCRLRLTDDSV